jgi:membrane protein implicated in regulation of membrane protease activity
MNKKSEISTLKAWLIVLASLIDDAVVLGLVFLGLWLFHIQITLVLILALAAGIIVWAFIMHKAVVPAMRRRKLMGAEGMISAQGVVTVTLDPVGMVEIKGEYWKAAGVNGKIEKGRGIEVVGIKGLTLEVKEK